MNPFSEDLEHIAEAHHLSSMLPHSKEPDFGFLHHVVGKLGDVVRAAQSKHMSGNSHGAAELLDPSIEHEHYSDGPKNAVTEGPNYPYPGSSWSSSRNASANELVSNIHGVTFVTRGRHPEHDDALGKIYEHVKSLNVAGYRRKMAMRPADYEDLGQEGDPHAPIQVQETPAKKPLER